MKCKRPSVTSSSSLQLSFEKFHYYFIRLIYIYIPLRVLNLYSPSYEVLLFVYGLRSSKIRKVFSLRDSLFLWFPNKSVYHPPSIITAGIFVLTLLFIFLFFTPRSKRVGRSLFFFFFNFTKKSTIRGIH